MSRKILVSLVVLGVVIGGVTILQAIDGGSSNKNRGSTINSPIIKLEEVEIVLVENGKEISKKVSKTEEEAILSELRKKALEKIGVKSWKELEEKKLWKKHSEEVGKLVKEIKTLEQQKLKFIDAKGKVVKEILLGEKRIPKKFKDPAKNKEWNGYQSFYKNAIVSKNQKYAILTEFFLEVFCDLTDPKQYEEYIETHGVEAGNVGTALRYREEFVLHDSFGRMLYKKEVPKDWSIGIYQPRIAISDKGIFACIIETDIDNDGPYQSILYVYDKLGNEILKYPKENEKAEVYEILKISPNGKYIALRVRFPLSESIRAVFFDLESGKSWKADKDYIVYGISDDGKVTLSYYDEIRKKESTTEIINIKKYLGE